MEVMHHMNSFIQNGSCLNLITIWVLFVIVKWSRNAQWKEEDSGERETTKGGSKEIRNPKSVWSRAAVWPPPAVHREGHTNRQRRGSEGFSFEALHF